MIATVMSDELGSQVGKIEKLKIILDYTIFFKFVFYLKSLALNTSFWVDICPNVFYRINPYVPVFQKLAQFL